jgi:hypothetical protein
VLDAFAIGLTDWSARSWHGGLLQYGCDCEDDVVVPSQCRNLNGQRQAGREIDAERQAQCRPVRLQGRVNTWSSRTS